MEIDAEFELKCLTRFGLCSDKVATIVKSWKNKQVYSNVYNKKRRLEGQMCRVEEPTSPLILRPDTPPTPEIQSEPNTPPSDPHID